MKYGSVLINVLTVNVFYCIELHSEVDLNSCYNPSIAIPLRLCGSGRIWKHWAGRPLANVVFSTVTTVMASPVSRGRLQSEGRY